MKRSTGIILFIFLALVGLLLYLNQNEPAIQEDTGTTPVTPAEFLFAETDGLPTSIDIISNSGEQVWIERNEAGEWVLKQPIETEANQGAAEAAASQLTALRIVSRPEVAPTEAGLVPSAFIMTVELTGGMVKVVRIGDLTPTNSGYYSSVDDSSEVLIISKTGMDALLEMILLPPFATTPAPTP